MCQHSIIRGTIKQNNLLNSLHGSAKVQDKFPGSLCSRRLRTAQNVPQVIEGDKEKIKVVAASTPKKYEIFSVRTFVLMFVFFKSDFPLAYSIHHR